MGAGCGLFGKVRPVRDFIAIDVPRPFLLLWEPWLAAGLAESRRALGLHWQAAFLTAPVWRFHLGPALCGMEAAGALMPSIDGAGRCFPLTLVACCAPGRRVAERDPRGEWFDAAEAVLRATLEDHIGMEAIRAASAGLAPPPDAPRTGESGGQRTEWWTAGGEACGSVRRVFSGLPPPEAMTDMLEPGSTVDQMATEARDAG